MTSSNLVFHHTDRTSHRTLRVESEPRPEIGPDEVLVQIRGVTLNYRDTIVANGTYPFPVKDDLVPCSDGAGVVLELGADVKNLQLGDRVIANFDVNNLDGLTPGLERESLGGNVDGVLRQYIALPAQVITKVPEKCGINFVQMASLVASGVTAWNALFGVLPLKAGQTVLFQGKLTPHNFTQSNFWLTRLNFRNGRCIYHRSSNCQGCGGYHDHHFVLG